MRPCHVCMHKQPECDSISIEVWICFIFVLLLLTSSSLHSEKTSIEDTTQKTTKCANKENENRKTIKGDVTMRIKFNILNVRIEIISYGKSKAKNVLLKKNLSVLNYLKRILTLILSVESRWQYI